MGLGVYSYLIIGRAKNDILSGDDGTTGGMDEETLDKTLKEGDELTEYSYDSDSDDIYLGIPVTSFVNQAELYWITLLNEETLLETIAGAKKKFKEITGIPGKLFLVSIAD